MGATIGAGTSYSLGADFTPGFSGVRVFNQLTNLLSFFFIISLAISQSIRSDFKQFGKPYQ
jgi:hypothetical protein